MEQNDDALWAANKLEAGRAEWNPNSSAAWQRLQDRPVARPAGQWIAVGATTVAIACLIAMPQSRAKAQELWFRLFIRGFDAVHVDMSKAPLAVSIVSNGVQQNLRTVEEANEKAGYRAILPEREVLGAPAELSVTGAISVQQVIQIDKLRAALNREGASDMQVPREWEGLSLRMEIGPMVIAEFGDGVQIMQARPFELQLPPGFPLAQFAATIFRSVGIPEWQARALGEKFAVKPSWLLDIPEDEVVKIEEVRLNSGLGLLIEDPSDEGPGRVSILFDTADRVFAVSSGSRERSIRIANAIH